MRLKAFLAGLSHAVGDIRVDVDGDNKIGAHTLNDIHRHRRGQTAIDEVTSLPLDHGKDTGNGDSFPERIGDRTAVNDHLFAGVYIRGDAGKRYLEVGEPDVAAEEAGQKGLDFSALKETGFRKGGVYHRDFLPVCIQGLFYHLVGILAGGVNSTHNGAGTGTGNHINGDVFSLKYIEDTDMRQTPRRTAA